MIAIYISIIKFLIEERKMRSRCENKCREFLSSVENFDQFKTFNYLTN